jgi:hypothetical protein
VFDPELCKKAQSDKLQAMHKELLEHVVSKSGPQGKEKPWCLLKPAFETFGPLAGWPKVEHKDVPPMLDTSSANAGGEN